MQVFSWLKKSVLALMLLAGATSAFASRDITNRDLQALHGLKAVVLLDPELDEAAAAAGVTSALIARRTAVYLRDVGVRVVDDSALAPGDRGAAATLLIQFGAAKGEARRTDTFVTINVLREKANEAATQPVYVAQERGLARGKVTRNYFMRELDLALNMLREDLRRARR
ncbi:hypothetical protein G7047_24880 [Diaphorobacter sp. HDW4A]|uniref:hypothetical protein n=1 Tax=Diaphorobacter sp. HDW4A TaxID=2714924 RepID=UPI001408DAB7|nr:hypothetical protein [Diaphorobacter sp. HDW4A]QIL82812.1 hypothetical protein G7047_24880 [Diaphorobacter sp. HDW4A]